MAVPYTQMPGGGGLPGVAGASSIPGISTGVPSAGGGPPSIPAQTGGMQDFMSTAADWRRLALQEQQIQGAKEDREFRREKHEWDMAESSRKLIAEEEMNAEFEALEVEYAETLDERGLPTDQSPGVVARMYGVNPTRAEGYKITEDLLKKTRERLEAAEADEREVVEDALNNVAEDWFSIMQDVNNGNLSAEEVIPAWQAKKEYRRDAIRAEGGDYGPWMDAEVEIDMLIGEVVDDFVEGGDSQNFVLGVTGKLAKFSEVNSALTNQRTHILDTAKALRENAGGGAAMGGTATGGGGSGLTAADQKLAMDEEFNEFIQIMSTPEKDLPDDIKNDEHGMTLLRAIRNSGISLPAMGELFHNKTGSFVRINSIPDVEGIAVTAGAAWDRMDKKERKGRSREEYVGDQMNNMVQRFLAGDTNAMVDALTGEPLPVEGASAIYTMGVMSRAELAGGFGQPTGSPMQTALAGQRALTQSRAMATGDAAIRSIPGFGGSATVPQQPVPGVQPTPQPGVQPQPVPAGQPVPGAQPAVPPGAQPAVPPGAQPAAGVQAGGQPQPQERVFMAPSGTQQQAVDDVISDLGLAPETTEAPKDKGSWTDLIPGRGAIMRGFDRLRNIRDGVPNETPEGAAQTPTFVEGGIEPATGAPATEEGQPTNTLTVGDYAAQLSGERAKVFESAVKRASNEKPLTKEQAEKRIKRAEDDLFVVPGPLKEAILDNTASLQEVPEPAPEAGGGDDILAPPKPRMVWGAIYKESGVLMLLSEQGLALETTPAGG